MMPVQAFESVSTWRQPVPPPASPARSALIADVAARVAAIAPERLRVAIDGLTCAGKTSFGHELAAALRKLGRPTARASLDDFKNSWREARELGYDRLSGEGYYRNAYDFRSARELLLGLQGDDERVIGLGVADQNGADESAREHGDYREQATTRFGPAAAGQGAIG